MKVKVNGVDRFPGLRKEIIKEARREIFEQKKILDNDFDAAVLWTLHRAFGFGAKRLRRFYDAFLAEYDLLREFYTGTDADGNAVNDGVVSYACRDHLKRIGVDIEEWNQSTRRKEANRNGHHEDGK